MEESKTSSDFLHFGQLIYISLEDDSFIYSKGFIDNSIHLQQFDPKSSIDFSPAVFRVLPQFMYSVQKDLLSASEELAQQQFNEKFTRHEENLEGEIKTNIQTYNNFKGEPIKFGSIIQLQHVLSYKFITLVPQENAEFDKENLRLKLADFANECSYIRIEPGFRYQKESDGMVRTSDRVVFEILLPDLTKSAYVNSIDLATAVKKNMQINGTVKREVNASLDQKIKWKIINYSKFINEKELSLACGDYIWLTQSEEESCLIGLNRGEGCKVMFHHNMNDTNGLWKLESENDREGGYITSEKVFRLKHASSGLYLTLCKSEVKKGTEVKGSLKKNENKVSYEMILAISKDVYSLWKFQPLLNSKKVRKITKDDFCVIINHETGTILHGTPERIDDNDYKLIPTLKKIINEKSYFKIYKCEDSFIWSTLFLLDCMPILLEYPLFVLKHSQIQISQENVESIREFKKHSELVQKCLENLSLFCKNTLKSMVTVNKHFGQIESIRQKILREQLFIDALVDILNTIFVGRFSLNKISSLLNTDNESSQSNIKLSQTMFSRKDEKKDNREVYLEITKSQVQIIVSIAKQIYSLLSEICKGNPENQKYSFKFFRVFRKHAAFGLGATNTIKTILDQNESLLLQLHKVHNFDSEQGSDSIIGHYAWLLRKHHRQRKPQLIEFLRFICTYKGEGLSVNQEKIHETLFGNAETHSKAIITTSSLYDKSSLYVYLHHPSEQAEENVSLDSCFIDGEIDPMYKNEIEYFIVMLELFSDLCTGRNYICKASIKDWFPIQALVAGIWSEHFSPEIRAAFLKLMLNMHVDSQPRQEIHKPELVRVLGLVFKEDLKMIHKQNHLISHAELGNDLSQKSNKRFTHFNKNLFNEEEDDDYIIKFADDEVVLYELKENVIRFLEKEGNDPKFNILTHQVLKMGRKLAKFEVLGVACSDSEPGFCVLHPKHKKFSYEKMDLIRLLNVIKPLLLFGVDSYEPPQKSSQNVQNEKKKMQENFETLLTKLLIEANSLGDPVVRYTDNLRNYLRSNLNKNIVQNDSRTYEDKCKIEICQLLHYVLDWRQDYLLSNLIMWFNTVLLDKPIQNLSREVKNLFPQISNTQKPQSKANFLNIGININLNIMKMRFDILRESDPVFKSYIDPEIKDLGVLGTDIITKLLKLFCYSNDYKLKSLTLNLILRSFNQRTELMKNVKKLHVMTLIQDTEIFTWTKSSLYIFKQISEQSELWLKYWAQGSNLLEKSNEKMMNVQNLLDKFSVICYSDTLLEGGIPVTREMKTLDKDRQLMCYHLDMHLYIINLLRDGMYTLADIYDELKNFKEVDGKNKLMVLFKSCYDVLFCMVKGNPKIQKKFEHYLSVFTSFLKIPIGQIELICEIFRDNTKLCSEVKDDFIKQFIELIISEGRQARFLMVLEVIQTPCGTPIPEIQRLILLNLLKPKHVDFVCYMNKECTQFLFEPLPDPPMYSPQYNDEPFTYHSLLIVVLKLCGQGTSGIYLTEVKCQKILSIQHIFELLQMEDPRYEVLKLPLLGFFYHIYLDTEQKVEQLENSKVFLGYLNRVTEVFKNVSVGQELDKEFVDRWIRVVYLYKIKYIDEMHSLKITEEIYALSEHLKAINEKWHYFLALNLPNDIYTHITELGNLYNIEFPNQEAVEEIADEQKDLSDTTIVKEKWAEFNEAFLYNKSLKEMLSEEHKALYMLILDIEEIDEKLRSNEIFKMAIEYIKESPIFKPPLDVLVSVIHFLSSVLSRIDSLKNDHKEDNREKLQNQFCESGAAKVVLNLMCDRETHPEAFSALLHFSIQLLYGGNQKAQQDFYQYFITMTTSSVFFERISQIITSYIDKSSVDDPERTPIYKSNEDFLSSILRLLQLLCENHNQLLQNYLRFQVNSRSNFDMISITILLLEELMKKKTFNQFLILSQCFDTITEYIQGPCRDNQKAITDSKFLEVASGLLMLDEKSDSLEKYKYLVGENLPTSVKIEKPLKGWMISHLKYKCMISIQSLLEGQTDNYVITRMIRALNIEILKENLISYYISYLNLYPKGHYDYDLFQHYKDNDDYILSEKNDQDDETKSTYYQFIIEVGFLIYHLMCCFKDNDDPENKALIENELPELMAKEEASNFIATQLIGDLGKIGLDLFKSGFSVVSKLASNLKSKVMNLEKEDRKKILEEAYNFFQVNTGNVEVIFIDKKIFKVYFWIPPECHHLTKEGKDIFHNKVDRTSDKAKIQFLLQKALEMIEEMQHEFKLMKFFNKYKLISFFTSRVTIWKELAFMSTLVLNFFIISSFYDDNGDRFVPVLFYGTYSGASNQNTSAALRIIGIIQCSCSILIVTFFIMKTAPVLIQRGWRRHQGTEERRSFPFNLIYRLKNMILTLSFTLSNVDVLYHIFYMIFSILGIAYNPLYFSLHLLDIIYRYPSLQNIIKSVILPGKSLILTLMLIAIMIYLFSIWAYLEFYSFFDGNCDNMLECIKTTWDQSTKNGGGIGDYIDGNYDNYSIEVEVVDNVARFFFDNIFNILIMIIMMNIIQGIIVDTFAILREESERNTSDMENKCFICGKDKEYIERCTNRPFKFHCTYEHNEWNYIFFVNYLKNKESTEMTGVESSIVELIDEKEINWIPQQQGLTLKEVDDTEELQLIQKVDEVFMIYESLQKDLREVKKFFVDSLESKEEEEES